MDGSSSSSSGSARGFDIPAPASRPMTGADSASSSVFDSHSPRVPLARKSGSNGSVPPASERRRHRSKNVSVGHGDGAGLVAVAVAGIEGGGAGEAGGVMSMQFKDTANDMEDEERETLLSLLSGAYTQVKLCLQEYIYIYAARVYINMLFGSLLAAVSQLSREENLYRYLYFSSSARGVT